MNEEWRDAVGYEGTYQVSNLGNVRSVDKMVKRGFGPEIYMPGKIKKQYTTRKGYKKISISYKGGKTTVFVHRMVASAFLGDKSSEGKEVNHMDGNKSNNHVSNLEWVTSEENIDHAIKMGLIKKDIVDQRELDSISEEDKEFIKHVREKYADGYPPSHLAKLFGVSPKTINWITKR